MARRPDLWVAPQQPRRQPLAPRPKPPAPRRQPLAAALSKGALVVLPYLPPAPAPAPEEEQLAAIAAELHRPLI